MLIEKAIVVTRIYEIVDLNSILFPEFWNHQTRLSDIVRYFYYGYYEQHA
jgi:hypothetical protein